MYDWSRFWHEYPSYAKEHDLLKQVGKTVSGVSISDEEFNGIIQSVKKHLEINSNDRILDLCCGNGLITKEIAKECEYVVGVDFSRPLIEIAKKNKSGDNIRYLVKDVRKINEISSLYREDFTKVLCYEALAFFTKEEFDSILTNVLALSGGGVQIFLFGSVLDRKRIWNFFNTFRRKMFYYFQIKLLGKEVGLGKWWHRNEIDCVCKKHNLISQIFYQDNTLHTSHYRFDVKISREVCT